MKITQEEQTAIKALKKVSEIWPDTLWLFSANGLLTVMKRGVDRSRVMTDAGGVDPEYEIDTVNIPNDGGDW